MDTRQKLLIASIVLFVISLPWKLIGAVLTQPLVLLFAFDAVGTPADPTVQYICILIGVSALVVSWGTAAARRAASTLIFGSIAVMAALFLIIIAAMAPNAASLTGGELAGYLLWLGSPIAACLAGLTCLSRASNRP